MHQASGYVSASLLLPRRATPPHRGAPNDCPACTPLQTSTLDLENVSVFQMYIKSMYLGLCQLVGENLDPQTTVEQVMAILMVLYGSVMNASLFGQVSQLHQLPRGALQDALCHAQHALLYCGTRLHPTSKTRQAPPTSSTPPWMP